MAGIGFELKRLFRRKGLFATMCAYGYAGIVCTGPMLLGVLLVGILVLCGLWGVGRANQDLLVCMVTYTLLASLTLTSFSLCRSRAFWPTCSLPSARMRSCLRFGV